MREKLISMIDKPVHISTVHSEGGKDQPTQGYVFEVFDNSVDIMIDWGIMKTLQIAAIVKITLDTFTARNMTLEDPPEDDEYPKGKRALFEMEEYVCSQQARESIKAKAEKAEKILKGVHERHPEHVGTEEMFERAHFLVTWHYDYAPDESLTTGDAPGHNYKWAKESFEKVESLMKQKRPEEDVATQLRYTAKYAGRAMANFPNHEGLKTWFAKAEDIRQKISEKVRRSKDINKPFVPGEVE